MSDLRDSSSLHINPTVELLKGEPLLVATNGLKANVQNILTF